MNKTLYRDDQNKMLGGVCAGLAEYFDIDTTVMRLLFAFGVILAGVGFVPYIILWIVLPRKTYNPFTKPSDPSTVNYIVPPIQPVDPNQPFVPVQPKRSNGGVIVGAVLIVMGSLFLLHEFDFFDYWDLHRFWPVVLVVLGLVLIVTGQQRKPWDHHDWNQTTTTTETDAAKTDTTATTDNSTTTDTSTTNNNEPIV
jgi:phage shock protein C